MASPEQILMRSLVQDERALMIKADLYRDQLAEVDDALVRTRNRIDALLLGLDEANQVYTNITAQDAVNQVWNLKEG